jgi:hypothetical protein
VIPKLITASEVVPRAMPCPSCGKQMIDYGGSAGLICCGLKILYRSDGWFDAQGRHVKDDRLAGGTRHVYDEVTQVKPRTPRRGKGGIPPA